METLKELKNAHIAKVYKDNNYNALRTAKILGISKSSMYRWIAERRIVS